MQFFHLLEQEITINAVFEVNLDRACAGELAHDQFHEVEGPPDEEEDDEVRDEEGAASVLVSRVREPPHVPQTHGHGDAAAVESKI